VEPPRNREQDKQRRRVEAEQRSARNKTLGPLKTRVGELEASIEKLEAGQRARNLELARPETYENPARRESLLAEYQRDAAALAGATEAWELACAELESLEAGAG
jgi:ATP-binding cassette subfamily F protein 3